MNKATLENINEVLEKLEQMSDLLNIPNLQQALTDIKGIIDSPTDLLAYYETDFQLVNELRREVDPDSDLFQETMEKVKEYYSNGEGVNEAVVHFLEEKAPCIGDSYGFWTDNDLPRYMMNPQFGIDFHQYGRDEVSTAITLKGFHAKEEIKPLLEKELHAEPYMGDLAFTAFMYYGRDRDAELPDLFLNRRKLTKSLMVYGDDELLPYSAGYYTYYAIKDLYKDDLSGALEDTFHRIVDEYGEEAVSSIMGAVKADETDDPDAVALDLGYVIPEFSLGWH